MLSGWLTQLAADELHDSYEIVLVTRQQQTHDDLHVVGQQLQAAASMVLAGTAAVGGGFMVVLLGPIYLLWESWTWSACTADSHL